VSDDGPLLSSAQFHVFRGPGNSSLWFITKSKDLSASQQLKGKGINHLGTETLGRESLIDYGWAHDGHGVSREASAQ
jgi:hypothetical protein